MGLGIGPYLHGTERGKKGNGPGVTALQVDLKSHDINFFIELHMIVFLPSGMLLTRPELLYFPKFQMLCSIYDMQKR